MKRRQAPAAWPRPHRVADPPSIAGGRLPPPSCWAWAQGWWSAWRCCGRGVLRSAVRPCA